MKILIGDALDKAVTRFKKRVDTFMNEGLDFDEAYKLADRMFIRDHHHYPYDNRRICFECAHHNLKKKTCSAILDHRKKPITPIRFILFRCDHFKLLGSK